MALILIALVPVGSEEVHTLHGSFWQYKYPDPTEDALRFKALRRKELALHLNRAAEILGVKVTDVSDLEHGRQACDWAEAERLLRAAVEK